MKNSISKNKKRELTENELQTKFKEAIMTEISNAMATARTEMNCSQMEFADWLGKYGYSFSPDMVGKQERRERLTSVERFLIEAIKLNIDLNKLLKNVETAMNKVSEM